MRNRKIVKLVQVRNERKASEAQQVRRTLFQCVRNAADSHGDGLSGYALVTWDRTGHMRSAVCEGHGPIDADTIPCQARDALNRHLAAEMVENPAIINPFDYEPEPEGA